jgi:predicted alpha/beta-fold hydrolase
MTAAATIRMFSPMTDPSSVGPEAFRPAPGLAGPHVQTIAGKVLRPDPGVGLWRERLDTRDGDFLDLDFAFDPAVDAGASTPLVVLLHGLEGSARRRYMKRTYRALLDRGLRAVGLNFRGCSGEPNRAARAYHSGETGDLRFVLGVLGHRFPLARLAVLGYSLGGNVALKFLGEEGVRDEPGGPGWSGRVAAGAAVSVPFDLAAGARALEESPVGRAIYSPYFLRTLRPKTLAKAELLKHRCDLEAVRRARTIRAFDDAATAPLFGFDSAADYYARCSSAGFIPAVRVPTLVVHSRDDPFLPESSIPEAAMEANPAVTAVLTEKGGHQGYVSGSVWRPRFWVEDVVAEWLSGALAAGRIPGS